MNINTRQTTANVGRLKVQCFKSDGYIPVDGTKVTVRTSVQSDNVNSH